MSFKAKHTFEQRLSESTRVLSKYPERRPIIVEKGKCKYDIDKEKYLVPHDLTVGQFIFVVRKRLLMKPEESLFLFINGTLPATGELISAIYERMKDRDNFLYITYNSENVFGQQKN